MFMVEKKKKKKIVIDVQWEPTELHKEALIFFFVHSSLKDVKTKARIKQDKEVCYICYNYSLTQVILNEKGVLLVSQNCSVFLRQKHKKQTKKTPKQFLQV